MVTTQDTRDDVRAGIVSAATQLLREKGANAVTTRAVAQAAGVQAPTIYRLFGDKDGLIDAVAEHVMATYVSGKAVAADGDPVADLRAGWRAHVEFGLTNPELYALIATRGSGAPSPATVAGLDVLRRRVRRLAASGLLRVDEERALMMIHSAGNGTILTLLGMPADQRDPGLGEAMLDAVLTSILATTPITPDTTANAVAVTFATVLPNLPGLTDAERALMAEWLHRSLTHQTP
ncbi:TetR/AcrR family transcriptional regulator [Micromonospora noduli]|uniref:Tetracycline repressor protein class A n=1 Tax=Micromonospora noduli TaxID=709876 RepID=A0ABX9D1W8_9ACTN|nr:TetR/AcrR family transcriptional regulator [Micromonospora noduli]KAB1927243.1 TetR/AcrR family transcriptional regulator [Micromonospora noduli]RAO16688.1 Tetracycline repressor protein class A [Micromonospora noduli]RAO23855.1 Tetracycline repressor protein class A [Micromonospora noduli]